MELHALFKPKDKADLLRRIERGEPLPGKKNPQPLAEPPENMPYAENQANQALTMDAWTRARTGLFGAITDRDIAGVKAAIDAGENIHLSQHVAVFNHPDDPTGSRFLSMDMTPIRLASCYGFNEAVELLQKNGAKG